MEPKISIIVPVYNAELYISKCIDSILCQTFKYFELIIVNDGSKDKTSEICNSICKNDSRVKLFDKENGGVSSARNYGISRAISDYIMFIDSDDWIEVNALEIINNYIENNNDIIFFSSVNDYIKKEKLLKSNIKGVTKKIDIKMSKMNEYFIYLFKSTEFPSCWNKVFKRRIIKENNIEFNSKMIFYEDFEFNLRYLSLCKDVLVVPDILYHYNIDSEISCISKRNKLNLAEDIHYLLQSLNYLLEKINFKDNEMIYIYEYMTCLYSLCFNKIVNYKCDMKNKIEVLKFIKDDKYFINMVNNYGINMRFYKILIPLLNNKQYKLAYYFIKIRLK